MFLLTKCLFAGQSSTVLIVALTYFFVLGSRTFATCATSTFIFLESPFVFMTLMCCSPIFVWTGVLPISYFLLPRAMLYNPPVGFREVLALCTMTIIAGSKGVV